MIEYIEENSKTPKKFSEKIFYKKVLRLKNLEIFVVNKLARSQKKKKPECYKTIQNKIKYMYIDISRLKQL